MFVLAKWDKIEDTRAHFEEMKLVAKESLPQARGAPLVTISAMAGVGLDRLMKAVLEAHGDWTARVNGLRAGAALAWRCADQGIDIEVGPALAQLAAIPTAAVGGPEYGGLGT